ncbi:MAG: MBL fold metallo-hydrolase [bacterium]|nr:MBL fold metallo-hydrolase [Deltaproteobacteria bacterium]MCP4906868.1 MBL fold metallo-hydrolase [bacterium]
MGAVGILIVAAMGIVSAQAASAQQDLSKVEIETIELGSGLAMLRGVGGNIGVSVGPEGVFLIDDQFAPLTDKIRAAVSKLSSARIRFLLNTHWHGDHTGGNENLGRGGVLIMAHDRVRARLSTDQVMAAGSRKIPAAPPIAWPVLTFGDGITLHLNGHTIEVRHVGPAHTDGDSIVRFVEADVLHLGDTFFSGIYPFFDTSSGGHIDGMIAAADRGLALAGPGTRIIPGHGPLSTAEDLKKTREMLGSVSDRVRKMIGEGLDKEAVIAARPTREFDATFGGGFMTPDRFTGIVYDSLSGSGHLNL